MFSFFIDMNRRLSDSNVDVVVYDSRREMYIARGATIFNPKYTDYISEARVIKTKFLYMYYGIWKGYKLVSLFRSLVN
jgi:hypothetical protein